jgi:hypothetical protein
MVEKNMIQKVMSGDRFSCTLNIKELLMCNPIDKPIHYLFYSESLINTKYVMYSIIWSTSKHFFYIISFKWILIFLRINSIISNNNTLSSYTYGTTKISSFEHPCATSNYREWFCYGKVLHKDVLNWCILFLDKVCLYFFV